MRPCSRKKHSFAIFRERHRRHITHHSMILFLSLLLSDKTHDTETPKNYFYQIFMPPWLLAGVTLVFFQIC